MATVAANIRPMTTVAADIQPWLQHVAQSDAASHTLGRANPSLRATLEIQPENRPSLRATLTLNLTRKAPVAQSDDLSLRATLDMKSNAFSNTAISTRLELMYYLRMF